MIGSEYVRKCDGTYKTVTGRKELQKDVYKRQHPDKAKTGQQGSYYKAIHHTRCSFR